ncbi:MAG: PBP1A family penicillin-binding protein [Candidatus Gastranaerophilales bacterium]|nr:PBP1A family penicillin-binding protein [Candidatus Gastranaerophilales bacterium]MCM1072741.1 PBP1A family penicillin-binding protein [Bacteroides sp.]
MRKQYNIPKARKRSSSNRVKFENPVLQIIASVAVLGIGVLLAGMIALKLYLISLPPIKNLNTLKPNIVTTFCASDGEVIKTFAAYTFSNVELKEVPKELVQALIATEDKNFYKHPGYDLLGLGRSMVANVLAGHVVQGASTLTQQLSRILFLSNEKTFTRKIKELQVAAQIEKTISKDKILEMYLNNVYLGSGAYGVKGAARIYFNKNLNELTLSEMALIAGLPQAPSVYSPYHSKELAKQRRNQVLLRMYKMKYIDKETLEKAKEEPIKLSTMPQLYATNKAPYFCDYVMKDLQKLGFSEEEIVNGGYKVVTTLNYQAQITANESILNNLRAWGLTSDKNQAAVFSFSPIDGRILVYVGGKDYGKSQYDRVTQSLRPSGSAFKPFIYTAALEKGYSPNDMIDDLPYKIGNWAPKNDSNKYRGPIPMYTALMVSSNVCTARLMDAIGVRPVIQLARVMGITTPIPYDYTIALGSHSVKLFEMTRAFGVFANGGFKVEPYAIERVESSRGTILYEAKKAKTSKVLNINTAATMTAIMKTVITNGTGRSANIGKPAAGKTGTTDNNKDAYFIGFTPDVVTGVWVGNDDNSQMGGVYGSTVPAKIWKDIMLVATAPYGNSDFEYPEIILNPFKASNISIIPQNEAQKAWEEEEAKANEKEQEESKADTDAVNPNEVIQQMTPIKKKEMPKIEIKKERQTTEPPAEQFAPIPLTTAPVGQ